MENIYLLLVLVLFLLAISDLIVGVANDAVNFLNSAVGSKAASFKIILFIAALGVLLGASFSGGMMEIARSGIFYPEKFSFAAIMLIFIAVMVTDVVLLDTFNTFGFPTSTTVSLIFELMGASVAIAVIQITREDSSGILSEYINTEKALAIISGILISVVIAFTTGVILQFITRLIFSFNYGTTLKYLGGIFGGLAITAIVYFILIKGAKDASFMTDSAYQWIKANSRQILFFSFAGFSLLLYLLSGLFKINILKIVVLAGTFALAMAFAGNDLVNFIGVPLAGYESYLTYINTPGADPDGLTMGALNGAIKTPVVFLLLSGLIMVVTLYTSRKARTVIMTEVNLSRQDEGEERFGSTALSRGIVSAALGINKTISGILPGFLKVRAQRRLTPVKQSKKEKNAPAFDLLRASVNLVASSALIALGTSMKLPLSTTYVTFMVAMGTSLSDGAWDRESAVYRITGVFSVVGGWFFTAISAFTISFILASLFYFGGTPAILAMVFLAGYMAFRTHKLHRKKENAALENESEEDSIYTGDIADFCLKSTRNAFSRLPGLYHQVISGMEAGDQSMLKGVKRQTGELLKKTKAQRKIVTQVIRVVDEVDAQTAYSAIKNQDNILEIVHCIGLISGSALSHLNNHHKPLIQEQMQDLQRLQKKMNALFQQIQTSVAGGESGDVSAFGQIRAAILHEVEDISKNEVSRLREEKTGNRSSILFMSILQETRNIVYFSSQLLSGLRDNDKDAS